MSACIIGDNASIRAGVLTHEELDDLCETTWAEIVDCPECGGCGDGAPFEDCPDCDWCSGSGSVTRANHDEWMEAQQ